MRDGKINKVPGHIGHVCRAFMNSSQSEHSLGEQIPSDSATRERGTPQIWQSGFVFFPNATGRPED